MAPREGDTNFFTNFFFYGKKKTENVNFGQGWGQAKTQVVFINFSRFFANFLR